MKSIVANFSLLFILSICSTVWAQTGKSYSLAKFSEVSVGIHSEVYFTQAEQAVLIDASEDALSQIEVKVSGSELTIDYKNHHRKARHEKVKIYVSCPDISAFSLAGAVSFHAKGQVQAGKLKIEMAGSCSAELAELAVADLDFEMAGSGHAKLAGSKAIQNFDLDMAGSCKLEALELESKKLSIEIAGSGKARIFCSEELDASIAGSGVIEYKGSPRLQTSVAGSGKIKYFSGDERKQY